jgi:4-aminobutyrate aminotransferase
MIGLEIQSATGEPNPGLRDWLIDLAFRHGLLLLACGPSTIRFCPPLCVTSRQIEIGLELLLRAMSAAAGETTKLKNGLGEETRPLEHLEPEPA